MKHPDDNDLLRAGKLPDDPAADAGPPLEHAPADALRAELAARVEERARALLEEPGNAQRQRDLERALVAARIGEKAPAYGPPPLLGSFLAEALERAERRRTGDEKPLPLPPEWPAITAQLGGGLWPGLHVLVAGTGVGKTTWALQVALAAATSGAPVAYVGLELEEMQVTLRVAAERARASWSALYLGQANPTMIAKVRATEAEIGALPFHVEGGKPQGWGADDLRDLADRMRTAYPEPGGAGSRPFLIVVDFLQLVGDEAGADGKPLRLDLRERIGRAAYTARQIAREHGAAVLLVSSTARDKYTALGAAFDGAALAWNKAKGTRSLLNPDQLIGLGKESGEIEYAADSVTVAARIAGDVEPVASAPYRTATIFATSKLRYGRPGWTELRFNGHRFAEPTGGATEELFATFEAMKAEKRARKSGAKSDDANEKSDGGGAFDDLA